MSADRWLIELSLVELQWATFEAKRRYEEDRAMGADPQREVSEAQLKRDNWLGVRAELAAAKGLNCYPWQTHSMGSLDLGQFEVRGRSKPEYDLYVKPDEREDEKYRDIPFVLVTQQGKPELLQLVGWAFAWESGELNKQLPRPAHLIPRSKLRPMPLPGVIHFVAD